METVSKQITVANGATLPIDLKSDSRLTKTLVSVKVGTSGVLSFRTRAFEGSYETPDAPNSIDTATKKSIVFADIPLDGIEIANAGASPITVVITQYA